MLVIMMNGRKIYHGNLNLDQNYIHMVYAINLYNTVYLLPVPFHFSYAPFGHHAYFFFFFGRTPHEPKTDHES